MSTGMFTSSPRLKNAVSLINNLEEAFLSRIVLRICQQYQEKGLVKTAFTEEETVKFQTVLGITGENVTVLIAGLAFVIQQAAFHLAKPATLHENLKKIGLREEIASVVTDAWASSAKGIAGKLKLSAVFPNQLEDVQCSTHLQLAALPSSQIRTPTTLLHLQLKNENSAREVFTVELNHEELYEFYGVLESIQKHLDDVM